ncbi:XRE family transcriptional regulator [Epilithonimonas hominis]|uniref:XRE family transcriptional regulator n=1 Tax=Epilithonimonas hominis TaxID=420404 RepID=UPI000EF0033A|nr:XRE family transcriptional regulator [Epilithonimonas hominis]HAP94520.1 hypothetical protein [Chryseobacterium sp.]
METLAKQIKKTEVAKTAYQSIADEFNSSALYVGQIARGERTPIRGIGKKILDRLQELTSK